MIVYFEGVDGSGKSTIIKKLQEEFGYKVIVPPQRQDDKCKEYLAWEDFASSYKDTVVLCDRGFISEFVYRLIDNEKTFLNLTLFSELLNNCKIVHCISQTSFTDAQDRGEDHIVTFEQHNNVSRLYFEVMHMINTFTKVKAMLFDWHINTMSDVIKFINS